MNKKTYFEDIKPHILRRGDVLKLKEYKELAEKTDEIGKKHAEPDKSVFDSVNLDKYYLTCNPYNVLAERSALVPIRKEADDGNGPPFVPAFLKDKPKMLDKLYSAVCINGDVYKTSHPDVVRGMDTNNYILEEDAYHVQGHGYYEKNNGIVRLGNTDKWARESEAVMTQDMGYLWWKGDCYAYHTDDGEVEHYRYRNLAPDAGRRILRFEEYEFPDPNDISESRIGIELEYKSAIDGSVSVLKSDRFRSKWASVRDGSIVPDDVPRNQEKATEFVSIPLRLRDVQREVRDFMRLMKRKGARTHKKCGFHVHIGKPGLDFHDLTSLVVLCENVESDLFRLVPDHRQNNEYCKRLDSSFSGFRKYHKGKVGSEKKVAEIFYEGKASAKNRSRQGKWRVGGKRHYWLSVDRYWYCKDEPHKRTIEFRMHHATHRYDEFLKFVLLCYYISQYAFNKSTDKCMKSSLEDVVESISNRNHYNKVADLLKSKKVIIN